MVGQSLSQLSARLVAHTSRFAVKAATVVAIAGMLIAAAPREAAAQGVNPALQGTVGGPGGVLAPPPRPPLHPWVTAPYTLNFTRLECVRESYGQGSDEPYVLFMVANIESKSVDIIRTSVFSDVDTGENRYQTIPLWGGPMPSGNPDNLVVLAQVMEHDLSNVAQIGVDLSWWLKGSQYLQPGLSRRVIVNGLKTAMYDSIGASTIPIGAFANEDDRVGKPQEVRITHADMAAAYGGLPVLKVTNADGGESDGRYRSYFELRRG